MTKTYWLCLCNGDLVTSTSFLFSIPRLWSWVGVPLSFVWCAWTIQVVRKILANKLTHVQRVLGRKAHLADSDIVYTGGGGDPGIGVNLAHWCGLPGFHADTGQQILLSLAFIKWARSGWRKAHRLSQLLIYTFKSLSHSCHFFKELNQLNKCTCVPHCPNSLAPYRAVFLLPIIYHGCVLKLSHTPEWPKELVKMQVLIQ